MKIGYFLSSEEYTPAELIEQVSYAPTEAEGVEQAHRSWANSGLYRTEVLPQLRRNIIQDRA